jgi:uncharacterized damage-inducible protein DinB
MFAGYNAWCNERLYDAASRVSDADYRADRGAFFKSLHGTLNHLLVGDNVWMSRFTGPVFVPTSLAQELHADFVVLRRAREAMDARILDWVGTLTEEKLAGELRYTSIVNPAPRVMPMALAVTHFFNHQTHHRGQATTLLMQRGIDPGVTDLMWVAQQDEPA